MTASRSTIGRRVCREGKGCGDITYSKTDAPATVADRLLPLGQSHRLDRFVYWVVSTWPFGKVVRQHRILSLQAWARSEVFAFVVYHKQGRSEAGREGRDLDAGAHRCVHTTFCNVL